MKLFENYLTGIDSILSKKVNVTADMISQQRNFSSNLSKGLNSVVLNENNQNLPATIEGPKVLFSYDKQFLVQHFGQNSHSFHNTTIGPHPDFMDLESSEYINHHCVSVFVDIKGSTRLIEKYSLLEVRLIKDSLLTLAIEVANQFGGHVHRLQGDGIFLQFVRKNRTPNDAVINALNAVAILTQFVTVDLAEIMNQYGIKPLKIRVGIDYGPDEKVLWSHYGIPGCGELTTTSLHTDMAAKLQAKAYDNSILIGGNVKELLDLKSDFYSYFENLESKEKVYYISSQFTYPFYVFNWREYLLSLPFIWKISGSDKLEVKEKNITLTCHISNEDGTMVERYYPNSKSIPKNKKIVFRLLRDNKPFFKYDFERIEWNAYNSGKEATIAKENIHDFNKHFINKTECDSTATYLGHHYVECKIIRNHSGTEKYTFPIFVQ